MNTCIPTQISDQLCARLEVLRKKYRLAKDAYGPGEIMEAVEELCRELEITMEETTQYLAEAFKDPDLRRATWLYIGLQRYDEAWPCFYRDRHEWSGYVFDWAESVREEERQKKRRLTKNPNYKNPCEDRCVCGMCFWYGDDDQWLEEERAEKKASKNIFFNNVLRGDVFDALIRDECFWKETQEYWEHWDPMTYCKWKDARFSAKPYDAKEAAKRQSPVRYVQEWRSLIIGHFWSGENVQYIRNDISVYWGSFFRLYEVWQRFPDIQTAICIARTDCETLREVMKEFYN